MKRQCKTCPWKLGTNPHDIPHGYSVEHHLSLADTIVRPGDMRRPTKLMACHYSNVGSEQVCIGWLANQLGPGHNFGLRMHVIAEDPIVAFEFTVDGEQHATFADTLPPEARPK